MSKKLQMVWVVCDGDRLIKASIQAPSVSYYDCCESQGWEILLCELRVKGVVKGAARESTTSKKLQKKSNACYENRAKTVCASSPMD
jgi:hypothetical protein